MHMMYNDIISIPLPSVAAKINGVFASLSLAFKSNPFSASKFPEQVKQPLACVHFMIYVCERAKIVYFSIQRVPTPSVIKSFQCYQRLQHLHRVQLPNYRFHRDLYIRKEMNKYCTYVLFMQNPCFLQSIKRTYSIRFSL